MTDDVRDLNLFDSNCTLGRLIAPKPGFPQNTEELLGVMDRFEIAEALVYHAGSKQYDAAHGNAALMEETTHSDRLHAQWVLLPSHTGEFPDEESLVAEMLSKNVKSARVFPSPDCHNFSMKPYSTGKLLDALENAAVPLFIDQDQIDWDSVHDICRTHAGLPLVLTNVSYRHDRFLYPLLDQFDNLHIELSYYFGHRAIESLVERFGAGRLLFGTRLPYYSPATAIAMLQYARIDPADRRRIAGDNLRALISKRLYRNDHAGPRPLGNAPQRHASR